MMFFQFLNFFLGFGAFFGLIGLGLFFLWFALRVVVRYALCGQPVDRYVPLRKLFLDL